MNSEMVHVSLSLPTVWASPHSNVTIINLHELFFRSFLILSGVNQGYSIGSK
jgi:hypothetical protein